MRMKTASDADGVGDRHIVTELECPRTGEKFDAGLIHGLSPSGTPLLVRYNLDAIRWNVAQTDLIGRPPDIWRYRELLPFRDSTDIVGLGETMTPLVPLRVHFESHAERASRRARVMREAA